MRGLFVLGLLCALQATAFGNLLAIKDPSGKEVWTDGDEFDKKLKVWQPNLLNSDWRMLGQVMQLNYDALKTPVYRFRNQPGVKEAAIVKPEGFTWVWDDRSSRADKDVSIWRASCPTGYVALTDFFYPANRIVNPVNLNNEAACVLEKLTESCPLGDKIWDDSGAGSWYDVGVWKVVPASTQVEGGFFANSSQDTPPEVSPRCLLKTAFTEL